MFPELLASSRVSLKEVTLTRDGEIISTFSDLKMKELPFYIFHLVPIGFRKIEHQVNGETGKHLRFSSGYLQTGEYRVETPSGEKTMCYDALTALWKPEKKEGGQYLTTNDFVAKDNSIIRPVKLIYRNRRDIIC
nr:hypothetical protein [uncultured Enterobacter sp.]